MSTLLAITILNSLVIIVLGGAFVFSALYIWLNHDILQTHLSLDEVKLTKGAVPSLFAAGTLLIYTGAAQWPFL